MDDDDEKVEDEKNASSKVELISGTDYSREFTFKATMKISEFTSEHPSNIPRIQPPLTSAMPRVSGMNLHTHHHEHQALKK